MSSMKIMDRLFASYSWYLRWRHRQLIISTAPRMYRLLSHIISCPEAEAAWLDELYEVMALFEGSKNA